MKKDFKKSHCIVSTFLSLDALLIVLLVIVCFLIFKRVELADLITGKFSGCPNCFKLATLEQDANYLVVVLVLITLSLWLKKWFIKIPLRLFSLLLLIIYIADVYVTLNYANRLHISDLLHYVNIKSISANASQRSGLFILFLLFLFFCLIVIFDQRQCRQLTKWFSAIISLVFIIFASLPNSLTHVDNFLLMNVFEANRKNGEYINYSMRFEEDLINRYGAEEKLECQINANPQRPNIVLVMVESLSPYQSKLISGLNDWTPNLDRIIEEGRYYDNFFANHYNSDFARVAMLTGELPIPPVKQSFQGREVTNLYINTQRTLPKVLEKNGYHSILMSGADLSINNTERFMHQVGFSEINDSRDSFYRRDPRFTFSSISDDKLYQNALNKMQSWQQPFFNMILTVTSHEPFIDPVTKESSIEKVIRYADHSLGEFYDELKVNGFFDNGILIITADHRSMTPIYREEQALLGLAAPAKIPFVIVGKGFAGVTSAFLQQADLLHSIESYIAKEYCVGKHRGLIFATPPTSTSCVYHVNGGFRDRVNVLCEDKTAGVAKLNGDNTKKITGKISQDSIDIINLARIREAERQKKQ